MAVIRGATEASVLQIRSFLGLNENPDGDTKIQTGEFSEMRNFCITRDKHLQIRPGQKTIFKLADAYTTWLESHTAITDTPTFNGAWEGMVGKQHVILAVYGGVIFRIAEDLASAESVGTCAAAECRFFGFSEKVYLLNGQEYLVWDGGADGFCEVEGYIPIVQTATSPAGAGTLLENVNRLTGKRRVKFSPNGTDTVFHLPQTEIDEVIAVDGTDITYTTDTTAGTVTFASAPGTGTNTITVTYRKGDGARDEVTAMKFAELFNGRTDTRVFLYGDGTNKTIYSGLDENGKPSAEYFPDLYEIAVGEANTPITSLVRHYARLLVFKTGSTWSVQYTTVTLESDLDTPGFYVTPVNRSIGNEAPGQVRLLENNPLSLDGSSIYRWKATTTSGNITDSQTNASRTSDRVHDTVRGFTLSETRTFNHKDTYEYWFLCGSNALILNYAADAWYYYTNVPFLALMDLNGALYAFTAAGDMIHFSRTYRNDNGEAIDAYASTGSMDFGRDFQLKYSAMIFVSLLPETNARIQVTAQSNRRSDYADKTVAMNLSSYTHVDFAHWSFRTNRKPQVKREKIKVKKATFYRLIFRSDSASATATVLETDIQFRFAGNVK